MENPVGVESNNVRFLKNQFLYQVLQWSPKWFLEHDKKRSIVTSMKLISPKLSYDTFDDYRKTQLPVLVHEFWYDMMESHSKEDDNIETKAPSIELFKIPLLGRCLKVNHDINVHDKIFSFKVRTKIKSDSKDWYPHHNTLVKFNNPLAENQEQFAYIEYFSRQQVPDKTEYELTYELMTKYLGHSKIPDSITIEPIKIKMSVISNYLNSLLYLPKSPLNRAILNPTLAYYEFSSINDEDKIQPVTQDNLNSKQLEIMARIVKTVEENKPKICIVSGPAGTGKSKVIMNSIFSMISRKSTDRILVCAQSNLAIDSIVLQLLDEKPKLEKKNIKFNLIRLGSEEKMNVLVKPVSFLTLTKDVDNNKKTDFVSELLSNSNVIVSTLMTCQSSYYRNYLKNLKISVCIVDEASQASELETFLPLRLDVKILFLVGDPKQFKPRLNSEEARKIQNLDKSLLHRVQKVFEKKNKTPVLMLDTQYRMVKAIAQWPNNYFYNGILKNGVSIYPLGIYKYKLLSHTSPEDGDGLTNIGEAKLVVNIVYSLLMLMYLEKFNFKISLGIIAPFEEQRDLIIKLLDQEERFNSISKERKERINIKVVKMSDCFQGSQCDIILMSCVKSTSTDHIDDPHRLCVSLTRARHTLIICGNLNKYKENSLWNDLVTDAEERDAFIHVGSDKLDKPKNIKPLLIPII
ncbi:uncharacterized protein LOC130671649 isoform X2 [Microplitis mediator]|nr:uncharacterized protein LOC130671649 isoform X2 [Microplitis mediator]